MARTLSRDEIYAFLQEKPRTAHLATVRADGRPHVAAIWIVVDGDDIVFTTWETSVKGRNLARTGFAALSVDDEEIPFAYVALEGTVTIDSDPVASRHWATALAIRYMGEELGVPLGGRNGVPGEVVCRLHPTHMSGMAEVTQRD